MLDHIKRERADVQRAKVLVFVFNVCGMHFIYSGRIESMYVLLLCWKKDAIIGDGVLLKICISCYKFWIRHIARPVLLTLLIPRWFQRVPIYVNLLYVWSQKWWNKSYVSFVIIIFSSFIGATTWGAENYPQPVVSRKEGLSRRKGPI